MSASKAIKLVIASYGLPQYGHGLVSLGTLGTIHMVYDPRQDITYHVDIQKGKVTKH